MAKVVRSNASKFLALVLPLLSFLAMAAIIILYVMILSDISAGNRSSDDYRLLDPTCPLILLVVGVFLSAVLKDSWNPYVFLEDSMKSSSGSVNYEDISRVHLNPKEKYMVIAFNDFKEGFTLPGVRFRKDKVKPSLEVLLDLLRAHDIAIEPNEPFLSDDLWAQYFSREEKRKLAKKARRQQRKLKRRKRK